MVPANPEELAAALREAARAGKSIELAGAASKRGMGGPAFPADVAISTSGLNRVLQYEPNDLTISVEAGLPWLELDALLRRNKQMIPLDPPCFQHATVGGVLAANTSGPRRRLYGSVRDVVIGMTFATLEGKLIQSGGMVVKNVAGLDMGKLFIGSFGTLGAIATVNFKLTPSPPVTRTFLLPFGELAGAIERRNRILESVLQPMAIDLLNPHAAARLGRLDWTLAVQCGGSTKVTDRYAREFSDAEALQGEAETEFWTGVREFVPRFLGDNQAGTVARVSCTLRDLPAVMETVPTPAVARAGNGIVYACFSDVEAATRWLAATSWPGVLEWIPPRSCSPDEQWPRPGNDLVVMHRIKQLLDPSHALNRGRLYGRI
jgi:glycolate oxidase FAD binding subunit